MKKWTTLLLCSLMAVALLTGCGSNAQSSEKKDEKKLSVVTTIFPEYDWVRQIVGENNQSVELTMLLDNGVDLHSYQPTADDIIKISTCDLFIYVGGESDEWVENALKEATNKDMQVINLLEVLGDAVKEEEVVEGMDTAGHDHDKHKDHERHEEDPEYDEHVWLSLKNAQVLVSAIADTLAEIDSDNAERYKANASAYDKKLAALDGQYRAAVDGAAYNTILFGDRFPFRYLADDYGLSYYAAFVGCSAETEASFGTITFLAQKMDELKLPAVLTLEGTGHKIAQTVVDSTQSKTAEILVLDSMQSTTTKDVSAGTTYLSIMEKNLEVLKAALN